MDRPGLDDGAARGAEPRPNRAPIGVSAAPESGAPAHTASIGRERVSDGSHVELRVERPQPVRVDSRRRAQEVVRLAVDDHADVDELVAVDPRDAAQSRRTGSRTGSPSCGASPAAARARSPSTRASRKATVGGAHARQGVGAGDRLAATRRARRRARRSSRSAGETTGASSASSAAHRRRAAAEHVVGRRHRAGPRTASGRSDAGRPAVVEVQRGTVVDAPDVAVPAPAGSGCASCGRRWRRRRRARGSAAATSGGISAACVEGEGAGQEVDAEVERRRWPSAGPGPPRRPRTWRSAASSRTAFSSGTRRPSCRASPPTITSATSTRRPWPAPRNFTT